MNLPDVDGDEDFKSDWMDVMTVPCSDDRSIYKTTKDLVQEKDFTCATLNSFDPSCEKEQKEVIEIASLEAGMHGDQDLALELEALGQPTLEAAWSSWIRTRSNRVWSTPQRYLLRVLVDGPLLILGAFCLGLALWGVFGGPGLGMDRLMDSLLVAALWLTGWRWLSGRLLARRASGERHALLGCLETALADAGGTLLKTRASVQVSQEGLLAQMGAGQAGSKPRGKIEAPFVLEVGSHGR